MIDTVMAFLKNELDSFVQGLEKPQAPTRYVALRPLLDKEGKVALQEGMLGLSLVNIEEERIHRTPGPVRKQDGNQISYANPPVKLRLYLLITAYFAPDNYETALKHLSYAISFFNTHNLFTPIAYPALNAGVERLSLELQSMTFEQINQLWGALGAKYMPSVLYVAKLAPIDSDQITARRPPVRELAISDGTLPGGGT